MIGLFLTPGDHVTFLYWTTGANENIAHVLCTECVMTGLKPLFTALCLVFTAGMYKNHEDTRALQGHTTRQCGALEAWFKYTVVG